MPPPLLLLLLLLLLLDLCWRCSVVTAIKYTNINAKVLATSSTPNVNRHASTTITVMCSTPSSTSQSGFIASTAAALVPSAAAPGCEAAKCMSAGATRRLPTTLRS
jgi:hypothetical protein